MVQHKPKKSQKPKEREYCFTTGIVQVYSGTAKIKAKNKEHARRKLEAGLFDIKDRTMMEAEFGQEDDLKPC